MKRPDRDCPDILYELLADETAEEKD